MSWLRLSDDFLRRGPLGNARPLTKLLHTTALLACAATLNDGWLTARDARVAQAEAEADDSHVAELVQLGLWEEQPDGGYYLPDYLRQNKPRDAVERERERGADRQQAWRDRRRQQRPAADPDQRNAVTSPVTGGVTDSVTRQQRNGVTPPPSAPDVAQNGTSGEYHGENAPILARNGVTNGVRNGVSNAGPVPVPVSSTSTSTSPLPPARDRGSAREGEGGGGKVVPLRTSDPAEAWARQTFEAFCASYPKAVPRDLWARWPLYCPDPDTFAAIMAGLERWNHSRQWVADGPDFATKPETFLRDRKYLATPVPYAPLSPQEVRDEKSGRRPGSDARAASTARRHAGDVHDPYWRDHAGLLAGAIPDLPASDEQPPARQRAGT